MKKVLSIVLTIAMVISLMPSVVFAADTASYSDISGKKCEAAVEELTELGVVDGYPDGTFKPEGEVTRAEMSKLVIAALGMNPTSGTTKFTDMDQAKWAIPFVGYAESLGIVNGYGGGKFGPNDKVTYDQAITMIVRMLGYTDNSAELQGTWPANYVQKANELGILKDVNKTGSDPAPRGDIAIMLANSLRLAMVYVDNDGKTTYRTGKDWARNASVDNNDRKYVTIWGTLTKKAGSGYYTTNVSDVNNAAKNIRGLLGAAGKQVWNEDREIISISDVKTIFMTGDFSNDGKTFTADDVDYKFTSSPLKELDADGKATDVGAIPYFVNAADNGTIAKADFPAKLAGKKGVTLAVTIDGKKIDGVYSAQEWNATARAQADEGILAQINKNHKLLGKEFAETNNEEIDTDAFILVGADSLDKIAEDNIVYVYTDGTSIRKIEVGTEVVSGTVSKRGSDYAVINGEKYKVANFADAANPNMTAVDMDVIKAGNEVDVYLDYSKKIAKASKVSSGNYAVVMAKGTYTQDVTATQTLIQLLTENGVELLPVNTKKVEAGVYRDVKVGDIIQYTISDGKVKEIVVENKIKDKTEQITPPAGSTSVKVTKKGFLGVNGYQLSDNVIVFTAPVDKDATGAIVDFNWQKDDEDYSVLKKDDLLEKSINKGKYVMKDNKIEAILVDDGATADSEYGVFTDAYDVEGGFGADYYIDRTETTGKDLDNATKPTVGSELYKISESTSGKAKYEPVNASATITGPADSANKDTVKKGNESYNLADDVIIYVWDANKKTLDVNGSTADLIDDAIGTNGQIYLYKTATRDTDDNYGLVTYIIVTKNVPVVVGP